LRIADCGLRIEVRIAASATFGRDMNKEDFQTGNCGLRIADLIWRLPPPLDIRAP